PQRPPPSLPFPRELPNPSQKRALPMNSAPKTVLCIHDLPGFGRAALSVIVPVLSALGVQAVALPTAVLSTHTGGLGTPARMSNPGYGPAALAHYHRLGLRFDCIYAGYL